MKIVVVGNSRDLLDRNDGQKIDACDRIIRINSFRLDGHEHQVGARIDIVCICLSLGLLRTALVHSAALIARAKELWTPSWRGQASEQDISQVLSTLRIQNRDLLFSDDTGHKNLITSLYGIRASNGADSNSPQSDQFFPTTGFQTIHLAEARFPGAALYITGFGLNSPLDLRRFDTSGVAIWPGHEIETERKYLLQGIEQGRWQRL
jgi:hypothetical protein